MSYINETDFVIENKKLVYPEIVADGLQLYYDSKGKRDTDYHRDTMLDMSGNKNHGKLHNFAYEKHSGYKDGLVFDYIDDKLVRPTLDLQPDDFTFMLNGNIISFSPDGTVKRVQDGEVVESKGFNLVRNGDFSQGTTGWNATNAIEIDNNTIHVKSDNPASHSIWQDIASVGSNDKFYVTLDFNLILNQENRSAFISIRDYGSFTSISTQQVNLQIMNQYQSLSTIVSSPNGIRLTPLYVTNPRYEARLTNVMAINLTETFGAGNEPTKEQMDEIINRFGFIPNAQDLVDHIEYKGNDLGDMENIIDGLYKTEVLSSEEIYTDKADDNAVVHVDIDGKSYQHAGSGKNLFTVPYSDALKEFRRTQDYWVKPITLKANTQYTFSSKLTGKLIEGTTIMVWSGGDKYADRGKSYITLSVNSAERAVSFNTEDVTEWKIAIYLTDALESSKELLGKLLDNYQIQLEEGSTATEYEPPAPTPDYPIEIHSLNDFDVVSSVGKENILENSSFRENKNGWVSSTGVKRTIKDGYNCYVIESDSFGNTRTVTQSILGDLALSKRYIVSGWVYTENLQSGPQNPTRMFYIDGYDINNKWIGMSSMSFPQNSGKWVHVSYITAPITERYTTARSLTFFVHTRDIIGNVYFRDLKMEPVNSVDDTYTLWTPSLSDIEEYSRHPLIDKINLILDEPLRSVGDVKDRLFRDSDGLWKIERNVTNKGIGDMRSIGTYSGSNESHFNGGVAFLIYYPTSQIGAYTRDIKSSHFKKTESNNYNADDSEINTIHQLDPTRFSIRVSESTLGVTYDNTTREKATAFRSWSNTNDVRVQYILGEPIIETLDQELQDKLNNLRSFEDSNYVYTVLPNEDNYLSNNLKPTLHAKFLYNNWYKEDRVINNLMIYNRALTNEEMLQNYKTIKRRWGM